jgi:hypothetical protein
MAPAWGVLIEGFRPERWDILGASVALLGRDHGRGLARLALPAARSAAEGRGRSYPEPTARPNAQRRRSAMTSNAVETVLASASLETDS